ncbi:YibE/F family protein, partial [bacterium]|nr:YibE/F family protein [bacterium]
SLSLVSHIRDKFLLLLILFFFLCLVLMGGLKKGLPTALSLILTLSLIFFIMLPLFRLGFPPLLVGILISIIAATLTLYLIGGGGVKSISAILSTIMGVLIVGGLALVGAHFMRLNGYHMEESKTLVFYLHHSLTCRLSDLRGLLLVGIIIGGLGVMMDVAISMASSVYEIREAHPRISQRELIKKGMNVGRDIMATMANSLILAYLGLTLPLILTFMIMGTPFLRVSNWAFLDVEILAALAGSIGFVLTIPLTVIITTTLLYKRIPFARIKRAAIILLVLLALGTTGVHARGGEELLPESELRTHPLVFIKEREEEFVRGRVLDIERKSLEEEIITFKVLGGRYKNRVVEVPNYLTGRPQYDLLFKEGDQAVLHLSQEEFFIADYVRDKFLFILAGVFVALLILIGRAKGLRTALALGITLALILFLFLPLIKLGFPPLPLSILVSILATLFTLYLVAGFGIKGHCAVLGTSLGILIAALLSLGAKEVLKITGFSCEGIRALSYFSRHYGGDLITNMDGVLTSAIIIGALGVVMDVAITVSSSMSEIQGALPGISQKELVKRGMNVGR